MLRSPLHTHFKAFSKLISYFPDLGLFEESGLQEPRADGKYHILSELRNGEVYIV